MRVGDKITAGMAGHRMKRRVEIAFSISLPAFLAALGLALAPASMLRAEPPDPPVTYNAGMGTADPPRADPPRAALAPAPVAAPVSGGIDGAGNGEAMATAHPAPAPLAAAPTAPAPQQPATATVAPAEAPAAKVAAEPVVPQLSPLGEALAALMAHPEGLALSKKEQEALAAFYAARQYQPVFVAETGIAPRGAAALARFAAAAEDGLDPNDYAVALPPKAAGAAVLAHAEGQIAAAALLYARHAQAGRFDPARISSLVTPVREIPDPAAVLATLAATPDVNAALAAFNPPHAGYKALKAQLAAASGRTTPPVAVIPGGPQLKPGGRDARVPTLRTRFGIAASPADEQVYDPALVEAVKAFQDSSNIKPTGIIGAATVDALNKGAGGAATSTRADIIANMERWRWLPRDLGATYVMVNIPEYLVRVISEGKKVHETRVVVGKPETPTPLLTRDMQYVVVNPAWNIPPSIARNEMMPLLRNNPGALSSRGIQVVRNGSGGYSFRQAPGERNALGRIKFMFPNDHSVYLHDTPSRTLFANDRRAYSHGCVRVHEPLKFGEVIFGLGMPGDTSWTQNRIAKMFGSSERYINLKQRFPVHLVYFNVLMDDAGRLVVREDLYGINAQTKAILGLEGKRRVAEGNRPAAR